jgi:hypothetical protein
MPAGTAPGQQGAPARGPVPGHTPDYFPMTVEENQAVPALVDLVKRGD